MRTIVPVTAVVLAGGASRRMGRDKRLLIVEGSPLIRRVVEALAFASETLVVHDPSRPMQPAILDGTDARLVADLRPDTGPLAGLEAGLTAAQWPIVVVVGADMPWLEPALLVHLADTLAASPGDDCVVIRTTRGLEPLLAAYRRDPALARATLLLDSGERRLGALLEGMSIHAVDDQEQARFDPTLRSARDIDTPADLARVG